MSEAMSMGAGGDIAKVEIATKSDIPRLNELLTLLFTQERDFSPDSAKQADGLERIIADPGVGHILVLRQRGMIVAMVNLLYTVSTALGERVAILEDMIVDPDQRRGGAGSQLLKAAIQFARGVGCRRITLLTDHDNSGAIRFYCNHGFKQSTMVPMRLTL
jgi:GNAT superfamily N-acetyltransferase